MTSSQQYLATSRGDRAETVPVGSDEPLKILRVASDLYPEVMGGLSLHVHEMSRLQGEWGHEVTVLTSDHGDRSKPRRETRDNYRIVRHREIASPLDNSACPGLIRTLHRLADEYDVIHAHSHLFFSTNVAATYRQMSDTPLVVTNHGLISQTAPKWLQRLFIPTVAKFTLESADTVLCYTETDKRRLHERGIDTDVSVVHNGIDCEKFVPSKREPREGLQILFVGRLKPGKGVSDLLTAFKDVVTEFSNVTLKIVGDGPLRDELVERTRVEGIDSNVEFVGNVPNNRMPDIYAESDVFTLPSLNEGLPRTVLEAMACEVPVVVSELPQLVPVIKDAGVTVPCRSPDTLASELGGLLVDSNRRDRMGSIGRQRILEEYSWRETVRKTIAAYERSPGKDGDRLSYFG